MCPGVASVEAVLVDEIDGLGTGSMEELSLVVGVFVLMLHALLQDLVTLPQHHILDPLNLQDIRQQVTPPTWNPQTPSAPGWFRQMFKDAPSTCALGVCSSAPLVCTLGSSNPQRPV